MDTRILKLHRIIALVLAAGLVLFMVMAITVQTTLAVDENDEDNDGDKPEITIEVVEDIPAADIEEQEVPLAATVGAEAFDNTRRMVTAWTLAVVAIAYVVFVLSGMRRRKAHRQMQAGTVGDRSDDTAGGKR